MRLIDADALKAYGPTWKTPMDAYRDINLAPTIEERKTGEWIDMDDHVMCSCCGATHYGADKNYCPNCGARMEKNK